MLYVKTEGSQERIFKNLYLELTYLFILAKYEYVISILQKVLRFQLVYGRKKLNMANNLLYIMNTKQK